MKSSKSESNNLKARNPFSLLFFVVLVIGTLSWGYSKFFVTSINSANEVISPGGEQVNGQTQEAQQEQPHKNFRKMISDMAWGRNRKGTNKPEVKDSTDEVKSEIHSVTTDTQIKDSPSGPGTAGMNTEQMQMMQARMEYCAKNWQTDPSCGRGGSPKK